MNPVRAWFRQVIPDDGIATSLLVLYFASELLYAACGSPSNEYVRVPHIPMAVLALAMVGHHLAGIALVFAAATLGVYRASVFHPVFRKSYRQWLESTPWDGRQPAPLGPIAWTPQDVAIIAAMALAAWWRHPGIWPWHVVLAFVATYALTMAVSFVLLGERLWAYLSAFALALLVSHWSRETIVSALFVAALAYGLVHLGLKRSLARFADWKLDWLDRFNIDMAVLFRRAIVDKVGWPYDALTPNLIVPALRTSDGWLLSLLAGCWTRAAIGVITLNEPVSDPILVFAFLVFLTGVAFRIGSYVVGSLPPISVLGRLMTGRLVIPGYDRIFVAPLLALGAGLLIGDLHRRYQLDWSVADPLAVTCILAPLLTCGPTLRDWKLVGHCRLTPVLSPRDFRPLP